VSFSLLKKILGDSSYEQNAHEAYVKLVEQARREFFYTQYGVADNLDGRFDVIVLHIFFLTSRLKKESPEFLRSLWEVFFSDMDRSLREMGVSDTGVGKRIKKMAQAFYGRIDAYDKTIIDSSSFKESLKRNLYREGTVDDEQLNKLAAYVWRNMDFIKSQSLEAITKGEIKFCD